MLYHSLGRCWAGLLVVHALLFSASSVLAQTTPSTNFVQRATDLNPASESSANPVVIQPEYPGGDQALITFLGKALRYPSDAYSAGAEGKVDISFWIDEKGHPYGFGVVESPHPSLAGEAIRAIKQMPDWTPGSRDGRATPMIVHVPVVFRRPRTN